MKVNKKHKIWGRLIANEAVRNTYLEELHGGTTPSTKTGDYSDVKVVTPYGEIPWVRLSRISDKEMRTLMLEVEKKIAIGLAAYDIKGADKNYLKILKQCLFKRFGISWDNPKKGGENP